MKVLIIGSTSTLGLSAGRVLSKCHAVFYAGRRNADYFLNLASLNCTIPENLQFDIVIHAAADFGGDTEEDIIRAEIVNAIGTLNVCRIARQSRVQHLIIISTASASYTADEPYFSAYALSKRHADELAMTYCNKFGLPLTILRPTQIYDAESKCKVHQGLFYLIIERAIKGEDIIFYGNNDASRNYIFIDDVAEVIARVAEMKVTGLYYCSAKESIRISKIAEIAYSTFNTKGSVSFMVEKPTIPDLKEFSSEELYAKLGYEPAVNLTKGIQLIKNTREMS